MNRLFLTKCFWPNYKPLQAAIAKPVALVSRSVPGLNIRGSCPQVCAAAPRTKGRRVTAVPLSPALTPKAIFITRRCCKSRGDWGKEEKVEGRGGKKKKRVQKYLYTLSGHTREAAHRLALRPGSPALALAATLVFRHSMEMMVDYSTHTKSKPAKHPSPPEKQQDAPAPAGAPHASQGSAAKG